jgi:zinc transport system substrate-binding protein
MKTVRWRKSVDKRAILFGGAGLAVASLIAAGCGSSDTAGETDAAEIVEVTDTAACAPLNVVTGFYPLQFIADSVVGSDATVISLAGAGVEPHDLELSPSQAAEVTDADVVVYIPDFIPSLDEAIKELNPNAGFDAINGLQVLEGHGHDHGDEAGHDHGDEADHDHGDEKGNKDDDDHGDEEFVADPHVWLDPTNVSAIGNSLAAKLGELDPGCSAIYEGNAQALSDQMTALDSDMQTALADCKIKTMVVSHEAFGYLANRYGFDQVGISGLVPDAEPSPKRMAEVAKISKSDGVITIYYESLVSPVVAEALASELGITATKLDPIEGPPESGDLISVMRQNLDTLVGGQNCG